MDTSTTSEKAIEVRGFDRRLRVELEFPLLWEAEGDSPGYVCVTEGPHPKRLIVRTDHFGVGHVMDAEEVRKKIEEYEEAIALSKKAIELAGS